MTQRCNHCQAENLVADNLAPGAAPPMCMRCGQTMQMGAAVAAPLASPASTPGAQPHPQDAASEFEGSTVMVMRPDLKGAGAGTAAAPVNSAAANEEAWYALVDGQQQGPHTLLALRHAFGEGRLQGSSLLWRAGMAAWTPLDNLPEVRATVVAAPQDNQAAKAQAAQALLHLVEEEVHAQGAPPAGAASAAQAPDVARPAAPTTQVSRLNRRRAFGAAAAAVMAAAAAGGLFALRARAPAQVAEATPVAAPVAGPAPTVPPPGNAAVQATSSMPTPPPPNAAAAAASAIPPPAPGGAPAPSSQPAPSDASPPAPAELEAPPHEPEGREGRHRSHGKKAHHGRHRGARH